MLLEDAFQKAVHEKDSRQAFLNLIAYRGLPEYIAVLRYVQRLSGKDREAAMVTAPCPHSRTSKIYVSACCFDEQTIVLDDFLSVLMDHEYFHARCNFSPEIRVTVQTEEYLAYQHQIGNLWRRKCSIPYLLGLSMLSRLYLPGHKWQELWRDCRLSISIPQGVTEPVENIERHIRAKILAFSLDDLAEAIRDWNRKYNP